MLGLATTTVHLRTRRLPSRQLREMFQGEVRQEGGSARVH
jgi:hypothetical protein